MLPSLRPVIAEMLRDMVMLPTEDSPVDWQIAIRGARTLAWCDEHDPDKLDLEAEAERAELLDDALCKIGAALHAAGPSKLADKIGAILRNLDDEYY